jgi:hypothetical protein
MAPRSARTRGAAKAPAKKRTTTRGKKIQADESSAEDHPPVKKGKKQKYVDMIPFFLMFFLLMAFY